MRQRTFVCRDLLVIALELTVERAEVIQERGETNVFADEPHANRERPLVGFPRAVEFPLVLERASHREQRIGRLEGLLLQGIGNRHRFPGKRERLRRSRQGIRTYVAQRRVEVRLHSRLIFQRRFNFRGRPIEQFPQRRRTAGIGIGGAKQAGQEFRTPAERSWLPRAQRLRLGSAGPCRPRPRSTRRGLRSRRQPLPPPARGDAAGTLPLDTTASAGARRWVAVSETCRDPPPSRARFRIVSSDRPRVPSSQSTRDPGPPARSLSRSGEGYRAGRSRAQ